MKSIFAFIILTGGTLHAQFINSGFDDGTLVPFSSPSSVRVPEGLPGWGAFSGDSPLLYLIYNGKILTSPGVSIHDANDTANPPIHGRFSIMIEGGNIPGGSAFISQPVLIPTESRSLLFSGRNISGLDVLVDGQSLPYSDIADGGGFQVYGADITSLAGQNRTIRFSASFGEFGTIDSIQFSPLVVPEPTVSCLIIAGFTLLVASSRKRPNISHLVGRISRIRQ